MSFMFLMMLYKNSNLLITRYSNISGDIRLFFGKFFLFLSDIGFSFNNLKFNFFSKFINFRINFLTGYFFFNINNYKILYFILKLIWSYWIFKLNYKIIRMELWGLGLRFLPWKKRKWKHNSRLFIFRIGLSHRVMLKEFYDLRILKLKKRSDFRRRNFFFISNNRFLLRYITLNIRLMKQLNFYKYRGFKFSNEEIAIRLGKSLKW